MGIATVGLVVITMFIPSLATCAASLFIGGGVAELSKKLAKKHQDDSI